MERITRNNSAICDHQLGLLIGAHDITVAELKHNVVALAKAAKILGIPTIVSTTAKDVLWGPTFPELVAVDTKKNPIDDRMAVEPDAIFVRDDRVWSSVGVRTGIDLALALIEDGAGRQVAMNVARLLMVHQKRAGGQSQYSALLAAQVQSKSETFDALDRWIADHLKEDLRVDALAERVHMSPRNFARVYVKKRGCTPAKAVEAIRVEAARRRLEETERRIESIAEDSGFTSEEQMRCAFIRILGIPPREYRKALCHHPGEGDL